MRVVVITLGRSDRGPYGTAVERYRTRLAAWGGCEVRGLKASRAPRVAQRRHEDAETLLRAARAEGGYAVLLDERGTVFTTRALAAHVGALQGRGEHRLTFLVGAADGVDATLRDALDESWSLSPLTLSHELALVVLLEQLYRVASLLRGHPYHRS